MARLRPEFMTNSGAGAASRLRLCDHPECAEEGQFRAPRSRDALTTYLWFCLDHVRRYNAAWNYYAGMNEQQIEAEIRQDTVWQRPTWPLGWNIARGGAHDPLDIFGETPGQQKSGAPEQRRVRTEQERALAVFDLTLPFTLKELKRRYKHLVKLHHPDTHGGSKEAEEQLKAIIQAYTLLKTHAAG